jgi:uncharacterized repeat protein (TIGR03847 family)
MTPLNPSFDLEEPDHFTAGAVGPPGQRVFYLQGRQARQLVTLKCEKEHVGALAEHLASMLAKLPAGTAGQKPGDLALVEPLEAAWAVGSLGVGYDDARDRIVIVAAEVSEEEDDEEQEQEQEQESQAIPEDRASARFAITRAQAAGFIECARTLIRAGRPICPMCSGPMDPGGHVCPRSNGHVVH